MRRTDFDFYLPPELIAQRPPAERGSSRMLIIPPAEPVGAKPGGTEPIGTDVGLINATIRDFPAQLRAGDLLVFNDTRVIPARLFGEKASGGKVELMVERLLDARELLCQIRASKAPKPGTVVRLYARDGAERTQPGAATEAPLAQLEVLGREGEFYHVRLLESADDSGDLPGNLPGDLRGDLPADLLSVLDACGHIPLPPYIERSDEASDHERYQTVFAREPGAVAAPTAGLHFTDALIADIRQRGVRIETATLHVGAGTFQPMRVEELSQHRMHSERYVISAALAAAVNETRLNGGRVIAIGTTSVRALESAARHGRLEPGSGETRLFITPGYQFQLVDALLTNFHLPQSTLLMLVSAFIGRTRTLEAYAHAVREGYRFFSYGDAMWIPQRADPAQTA